MMCMQTVHGCAALALLVPVFFHWYAPPQDDEEGSMDWAVTGLSWQAKLQLAAFCVFEVNLCRNLCSNRCGNPFIRGFLHWPHVVSWTTTFKTFGELSVASQTYISMPEARYLYCLENR